MKRQFCRFRQGKDNHTDTSKGKTTLMAMTREKRDKEKEKYVDTDKATDNSVD